MKQAPGHRLFFEVVCLMNLAKEVNEGEAAPVLATPQSRFFVVMAVTAFGCQYRQWTSFAPGLGAASKILKTGHLLGKQVEAAAYGEANHHLI